MSNVTKITLTNESIVNANGKKRTKNAKPVFCIDTGAIYASSLDAAEALGVHSSSLCAALTGKTQTCKGMRFCFLSKVPEHFEEITTAMKARQDKIMAYDKIVGRQQAIENAKAKVEQHKANYIKLQQKLEDEMNAYYKAEEDLKKLTEEG